MAEDKEGWAEWADLHGYVRIHCKIHGNSWSDGGICEYCDPKEEEEESGTESESDSSEV